MSRVAKGIVWGWMASHATGANAVTIGAVRAEMAGPSAAPTAAVIRFQLDSRARVGLDLYDGADGLVRHIQSEGLLPAGDHALSWDLRDATGKPVPPDVYCYVLRARGADGSSTVHDLSDVERDTLVPADAVEWHSQTRSISYTLRRPARVKLRVGIEAPGPLLHTVVNMAPRAGGPNSEVWDGQDSLRLIDIAAHPGRAIAVTAYALPPNALIVGRASEIPLAPPGDPSARRAIPGTRTRPPVSPWSLRDYTANLLVVSTPGDVAGTAQIGKAVKLRVDVPAELRSQVLGTRLEPVFFVDGRFVFENETGFLPMTWEWTPTATDVGEHVVSVNLRGYEGQFGIASVKLRLTAPARAAIAPTP